MTDFFYLSFAQAYLPTGAGRGKTGGLLSFITKDCCCCLFFFFLLNRLKLEPAGVLIECPWLFFLWDYFAKCRKETKRKNLLRAEFSVWRRELECVPLKQRKGQNASILCAQGLMGAGAEPCFLRQGEGTVARGVEAGQTQRKEHMWLKPNDNPHTHSVCGRTHTQRWRTPLLRVVRAASEEEELIQITEICVWDEI